MKNERFQVLIDLYRAQWPDCSEQEAVETIALDLCKHLTFNGIAPRAFFEDVFTQQLADIADPGELN